MVDPLRIAHVTATFPPYRGGTGNVCYYNARELARRGHDVHVFTAAAEAAPAQESREGVQIHRLRPLLRMGNAPLLPHLAPALRGFDVIHLHYPFIFGAELVRLASLLYGTPFVITHHNDLIGDGARARLFASYQRVSAWTTVRHARYACAVSLDHYNSSRLQVSMNGNGPPAVDIPNGVDTKLFSPDGGTDVRERYQIAQDAKLALFVAALDRAHHFKGLERLLRAMKSLDDATWLLIVGDGDMRAEYERQAETLGISRRTVFIGAIDHDQLPPLFRAADVVVLPSSPPESFGLVLIEAMACGTPVIASDIPGVRTVVADGVDGFLVAEGDVAALSERLQAMLALPHAQRAIMGQAGRRKVEERYAWEQTGAQLEGIYQQCLTPATTASLHSLGKLTQSAHLHMTPDAERNQTRSKMRMFQKLMPFDSYERHKAMSLLLGDGYDGLILDAGGLSRALVSFLPNATTIALNVDESGDVVYDGKAFPFSSGAFDVVVSLDTLEHLPREARAFFVSECLRTARETIIIAAPYGMPGHAMYEARLDQLQQQVTGHPHRWLHEHVVNGLPDADEILQLRRLVDASGYETHLVYSGDYESQCGLLERSLKLGAFLGPAGRLSSVYLMFASMALWHDIVFHEQPYDLANRFYLLAQRKGH